MSELSKKAAEIVRRGVQLYDAGRLRDAMAAWERALVLEPQARQAREYLGYVRTNYATLRAHFADGNPVPLGTDLQDAGLAAMDETRQTLQLGSGVFGELTREAGDDFLDLVPPSSSSRGKRSSAFDLSDSAAGAGSQAEHESDSSRQARLRPLGDSNDDAETVERQHPMFFDDIALPGDEPSDEKTVERLHPLDLEALDPETDEDEPRGDEPSAGEDAGGAQPGQAQFFGPAPIDIGLDLAGAAGEAEEPSTRREKFLEEPPETLNIRLPTAPPSPDDDDSVERTTTKVMVKTADGAVSVTEAMQRDVSEQVGEKMLPGESADEAIRRRVSGLLERAQQEAQRGRGQVAVVAAILALDEAPSSVVAQKLIHEHKEQLQATFAGYLGSVDLVPVLARPLHEVGSGIDSREAFLLSQIDGLLSFSDIIDVSGMPAIEAYRTLCRLLIDGLISVS